MVSRRELMIGLGAAIPGGRLMALADGGPVQKSAVIDWNSAPEQKNGSGSVRKLMDARTDTLDNLEVHVTTLNPGQRPHAPHRHGHEELLIVKEGTLEALTGGTWNAAGPGSLVFFASNELHGVRNSGEVPVTYHVIEFRTDKTPLDAK